jgi:hypothetical protein
MEHDPASPAALPAGRFEGREAFAQVVRDAFACAAQQGWREIVVSDASFEDWPLHERVVVDALQSWSKAGRRFTMVAARFDAVQRAQPRFVVWRRRWEHLIECRASRHVDTVDFPSMIWSPVWAMQRLDPVRSTGVCSAAPERRVQIREALDELIAQSGPGFPTTTLGL